MGGKRRPRGASSGDDGHVAETPGAYGSAPAPEEQEVPSDAVDLFNPARRLSAEERAVFHYGLAGKKNNEIAIIMEKSKRTVETQMANALRKIGVEDREAALVLYHRLCEARMAGENRKLREQLAASEALIKTLRRQLQRRS
jgi:DNA-binding CsgD family transcriptional regulator